MDHRMNRRECMRALGLSGLTAGLGWTAAPAARAQGIGESSGFQSSVIDARKVQDARTAATIVDGKVIQPQRELPILHQTDVLVVGGGSAGVVAAIAARRAGANVTLVERYGHFGGLWTGGLVVLILGHIVKGGKQVCQGIGEEMMRRMDKLDGAIIDRRPGVSPIRAHIHRRALARRRGREHVRQRRTPGKRVGQHAHLQRVRAWREEHRLDALHRAPGYGGGKRCAHAGERRARQTHQRPPGKRARRGIKFRRRWHAVGPGGGNGLDARVLARRADHRRGARKPLSRQRPAEQVDACGGECRPRRCPEGEQAGLGHYFPMQNSAKILSRTSSLVTTPVISPTAFNASRTSAATSSGNARVREVSRARLSARAARSSNARWRARTSTPLSSAAPAAARTPAASRW